MSERALEGLKQVMAFKSRVVLPCLVPQELEYCKSVVISLEDEMGVRTIMEYLLSVITQNTEAPVCTAIVLILNTFCAHTEADVSKYLPQLFRGLIGLLARSDQKLLTAARNCLDAITKAIRACLEGAGSKIADSVRRQLTQTLVAMLAAPEDNTRVTAVGCLGTLCASLLDPKLADLMIQHLLYTDPSLDWTLRHGHSMALNVALKDAADSLDPSPGKKCGVNDPQANSS